MRGKLTRKVFSLVIALTLILQQTGFAQGLAQLDISRYMNQMNPVSGAEKFRPLLLRSFAYNPLTDNFQLLIDKGDLKKIQDSQVKEEGQVLLKYFLIGISLPDDNFWVNLRPDSEDKIIDQALARTDMGKVLLEADVQLKKDTAAFTSPATAEGRLYWDKLYKKAGELFGAENITIPTLTRPWIVPQEVIIRETGSSAFVYKATLKVMLEQDHLKNSADYNFKDPRLKALNEYSSQLIREKILPKLTKEVNTSSKYASLRQAYYSIILGRWFKARFAGKPGMYSRLINSADLKGLTSQEAWSKATYFKQYQKSFTDGEYNVKEQVTTAFGPVIRAYFSGGIAFGAKTIKMPGQADGASSPIGNIPGKSPDVTNVLGEIGLIPLAGNAGNPAGLKEELATSSSPLDSTVLLDLNHKARWGNPEEQADSFIAIENLARGQGIFPASMFDVYDRIAKGEIKGVTVGAINVRTDTLEQMRRVFREQKQKNIGLVIFELALSEKGYTVQPPAVYEATAYIAAMLEGYQGAVYLQADHYQIKADVYADSPEKAREAQFKAIREAIKADHFGLDLDNSTVVALEEPGEVEDHEAETSSVPPLTDKDKKIRALAQKNYSSWKTDLGEETIARIKAKVKETLIRYNDKGFYSEIISEIEQKLQGAEGKKAEDLRALLKRIQDFKKKIEAPASIDALAEEILIQQTLNAQETALGTILSRGMEPAGITITIGGEIGEVGGKNSEPGEFAAYIELYNAMLSRMVTSIKEDKTAFMYKVIETKDIWSADILAAIKTKNRIPGLSKVAIQTGTAHGVGGDIDFRAIRTLAELGREYGVVVVQHGASKVSVEKYGEIVKNGAGEVHLATLYMEIVIKYLKRQPEGTAARQIYEDLLTAALARKFGKTMTTDEIQVQRIELEKQLLKRIADYRNDLKTVAPGNDRSVQQRIDELPAADHQAMGDEFEAVIAQTFINLGAVDTLQYLAASSPLQIEAEDLPEAHQRFAASLNKEISEIFAKILSEVNPSQAEFAKKGSLTTRSFSGTYSYEMVVKNGTLGWEIDSLKIIFYPHIDLKNPVVTDKHEAIYSYQASTSSSPIQASSPLEIKIGDLPYDYGNDLIYLNGEITKEIFTACQQAVMDDTPNRFFRKEGDLENNPKPAGTGNYHFKLVVDKRTSGLPKLYSLEIFYLWPTSKGKPIQKPVYSYQAEPTRFVAVQWLKPRQTEPEAVKLLESIAVQMRKRTDPNDDPVQVIIAPSTLRIPAFVAELKKLVEGEVVSSERIKIAAQDISTQRDGILTPGSVYDSELKELGINFVMLGHRNIRVDHTQQAIRETSTKVREKVETALLYGSNPIVFVGGEDKKAVENMVRESLAVGDHLKKRAAGIVIVYQPATSLTPTQAEEMHKFIRGILEEMFGSDIAAKISILYGGDNVTADNSAAFQAQPNINGVFVEPQGGRDVSEAENFSKIVKQVASAQASSPLSSSPLPGPVQASNLPDGLVGGIDFRAIPFITQPMGNMSGLNFGLPKLSNVEKMNLGEEFSRMQNMLQAGIIPSGDRLKQYIAACYQKGELKTQMGGIVAFLVEICRLEEEKVAETSKEVKEAMVILDSIG